VVGSLPEAARGGRRTGRAGRSTTRSSGSGSTPCCTAWPTRRRIG